MDMKLAKVPGSVWAAAKFSIAEGLDRNSGSVALLTLDRSAGSRRQVTSEDWPRVKREYFSARRDSCTATLLKSPIVP